MKRIKEYFELKGKYKFDITDLVAVIYTICVGGIILGYDMTIPFIVGCSLSLIGCLKAKRINLIVINVVMLILNLFYLFS